MQPGKLVSLLISVFYWDYTNTLAYYATESITAVNSFIDIGLNSHCS